MSTERGDERSLVSEVRIKGFRSIADLTLRLHPGLNVLVGPNGAGKTNILTALDFISHAVEGTIEDAVARAGGPSGVFPVNKRSSNALSSTSRFEVISRIVTIGNDKQEAGFLFNYAFAIKASDKGVFTRFDESLRVMMWEPAEWRKGRKYFVEHTNIEQCKDGAFRVGHLLTERKGNRKRLQETLERGLNAYRTDESLLKRLSELSVIGLLRNMVRHKERLLVEPVAIRNGDDTLGPPEISPTGGGIASTLAALQQGTFPRMTPRRCRAVLEQVKAELRLAVPSLNSFTVQNLDNRFRLRFAPKSRPMAILSASQVSDGTLKWLVLVTALRTGQLYSLEEPENYLHPWMQQELIRLLRDREPIWGSEAVVLSTHSETIVNTLRPEELKLVTIRDGTTIVSEPDNTKAIEDEMASTGFGLGHFYVAGAVSNGSEN